MEKKSKFQVSDATAQMLECIKVANEMRKSFRTAAGAHYSAKGLERELASFNESFEEMIGAMWEVATDVVSDNLEFGFELSAIITGIAFSRDEAQINVLDVPDEPGVAYKILGPVGDANINVDMIVQNISVKDKKTDLTFTLPRGDCEQAVEIVQGKLQEIGGGASVSGSPIAKVSLVGVGMRSHSAVASKMFKTLADEGINIRIITTSEIKISVGIDEKYLELAVRSLHDAFELDKPAKVF